MEEVKKADRGKEGTKCKSVSYLFVVFFLLSLFVRLILVPSFVGNAQVERRYSNEEEERSIVAKRRQNHDNNVPILTVQRAFTYVPHFTPSSWTPPAV